MARYAMLTTIDRYANDGIPPLKFAERDGEVLEQLLIERGFRTLHLNGPNATRERILEVLSGDVASCGWPALRAEDLFLFFFAGHGELVGGNYVLHAYGARSGSAIHSVAIRDIAHSLKNDILFPQWHKSVEAFFPMTELEVQRVQREAAIALGVPVQQELDFGGGGVKGEFVLIPPGWFLMGSPETEKDRCVNEVQHKVTISKAFYMGVYEVTVDQYAQFVKNSGYKTDAEKDGWSADFEIIEGKVTVKKANGCSWRNPGFDQKGVHPVVCVSWGNAQAFCKWLSKKTGNTGVLPTEAQWEYACRAGTNTRFSFGDKDEDLCKYGNYCDESNTNGVPWQDNEHRDGFDKTAPVGSFKPNAWGL